MRQIFNFYKDSNFKHRLSNKTLINSQENKWMSECQLWYIALHRVHVQQDIFNHLGI
jgi:hypothetical protein